MKNEHRTALGSEGEVSTQVPMRTTLYFCSIPSIIKYILTLPFLPQILSEVRLKVF